LPRPDSNLWGWLAKVKHCSRDSSQDYKERPDDAAVIFFSAINAVFKQLQMLAKFALISAF
jgi:hypothetical protein